MKKTTQLTYGLYNYSPRYFITWLWHLIKDTLILFRRIKFLLKHGYPEPARWETYNYFIDVFEELFDYYRKNRMGTQIIVKPFTSKDWEDINEKAYNELLDTMLYHLKEMREQEDYESLKEESNRQQTHCDEFFNLFTKHFYGFWD